MEDRIDIGRREFSAAAVLALLSGVAITITGCGGGGSSSPTSPSTTSGTTTGTSGSAGKVGSVSANHGHAASISSVQLSANGAVTLDIRGTADHPHTLDLTAPELAAVAAGQRLEKDSSSDAGHRHTVTFN